MLVPVDPLLQFNVPLQFAAVIVAFSLPHTWVLFAESVGTVGAGAVVIVTGAEATLVPQLFVQVAV